jgi:hypothetical protein
MYAWQMREWGCRWSALLGLPAGHASSWKRGIWVWMKK